MKTTRINTGIYKIKKGTKTFEAEKTYDGQWQLIQITEDGSEYIEHYTDLKSCKVYVEFYS